MLISVNRATLPICNCCVIEQSDMEGIKLFQFSFMLSFFIFLADVIFFLLKIFLNKQSFEFNFENIFPNINIRLTINSKLEFKIKCSLYDL